MLMARGGGGLGMRWFRPRWPLMSFFPPLLLYAPSESRVNYSGTPDECVYTLIAHSWHSSRPSSLSSFRHRTATPYPPTKPMAPFSLSIYAYTDAQTLARSRARPRTYIYIIPSTLLASPLPHNPVVEPPFPSPLTMKYHTSDHHHRLPQNNPFDPYPNHTPLYPTHTRTRAHARTHIIYGHLPAQIGTLCTGDRSTITTTLHHFHAQTENRVCLASYIYSEPHMPPAY